MKISFFLLIMFICLSFVNSDVFSPIQDIKEHNHLNKDTLAKSYDVCIQPNNNPIVYIKDNKLTGIIGDIFINIATKEKFTFNLKAFNNSSDLDLSIRRDLCDVIIPLTKNQNTYKNINTSNKILDSYYSSLGNLESIYFDLNRNNLDKHIFYVNSIVYENIIKNDYPMLEIVYEPNIDKILDTLQNDSKTHFISNEIVLQQQIYSNPNIPLKINGMFHGIRKSNSAIGVKSEHSDLLKSINNTLVSQSSEIENIISSYFLKQQFIYKTNYTWIYYLIGVIVFISLIALYKIKSINREKEKFQNMFEKHDSIMLLIEPQSGDIINANNSAANFYGYTMAELKNMNIYNINQLSKEEIIEKRKLAVELKKNSFIFPHKLKNGDIRQVEVHSSPIQIGTSDLLFSIITDITEEEKNKFLLKETLRNLKISNKLSNMGQWKWKLSSNIIDTSEEFNEIYGIGNDEIFTDEGLLNLIHPDDRENTIKVIEDAFTNKQGGNTIYRIIVNGNIKYISVIWDVILDNHNNPIYFNGSAQDITKQKNLENTILEQNKRLDNINQNIPGLVYKYLECEDGSTSIPYATDKILDIYGICHKEVKNDASKLDDFVHSDDLENLKHTILKSKENMTAWSLDYRINNPLKGEIWVRCLAKPVLKENNCIAWYGYIYEITELKQKDELLKAQEKMTALGEMMGNIAHQWRQPLSTVSISASALKIEKEYDILTDENEEIYISNIIDSTKYLSETIDTFCNFLKDRNEKVIHNINLKEEITTAIRIISMRLKNHNINLISNLEDINDLELEMGKSELVEVVINIINNSIDAFENNNILEPSISINTEFDNQNVIITIEDNAGGIPLNIIEKIFEPYFTTKHKAKGIGLGLSMSHKIIANSLDGKLYCKNTSNGAKFYIEIPVK